MKELSFSIIILGVCIVVSSIFISQSISNSNQGIEVPNSFNVHESKESNFELIVSDGWLYLYDRTNGQVFKKLDADNTVWETINHYTQQ